MKYVKNLTQNVITVAGIKIQPDSFYQLTGYDDFRFGLNKKLESQIDNDIVLASKDGSTLLTKEQSKNLLLKINSSEGTYFDDNDAPFSATNAQEAIMAALSSPLGALFSIEFKNNGTASNTWLNIGEAPTTSDEVPFIVPFKSRLVGVTFSNERNNVDIDIRINISKYGEGNTNNRTIIKQIRNMRTFQFSDFNDSSSDLVFDAGDKIGVFMADQGQNPNDPVVHLYFKVIEEETLQRSENHASAFSISLGPITITIG